MNKKHWISVYFNQDVPDKEIKELVKKSYDIIVQKPDKERTGGISKFRGIKSFYSSPYSLPQIAKSVILVCISVIYIQMK